MPKRHDVETIQQGFLLRTPASKELMEQEYPPLVALPVLEDSWDFGRLQPAQGHEVRTARTSEDVLEALEAARDRPGGLHLRAAGHSMNGQTLPHQGIQLLLRFGEEEGGPQMNDLLNATVSGSASWERVVGDLEHRNRTIGVLTDHFETSVGGTLSMSGFGPGSLRYGRQVDMVDSLEVILPDGRILACGRYTHSDIFRACLAGWGGIGVIRKAVLKTADYNPYVVSVVQEHSSWAEAVDHSEWLAGNIQALPPNLGQHHQGMNVAPGSQPAIVASTDTFEFNTLEGAIRFAEEGVHDVPGVGQTWSFLRVETQANGRLRLRSAINALLQLRQGKITEPLYQLWQDFVFPDFELARRFTARIEPDLESPALKKTNFARHGCLVKETPSTPHLPLSFYAPGAKATSGYHTAQGYYFAVPRNRPGDLHEVKRFLRRASDITFELGGRPYLYGWHDMDGEDMQSNYGEDWEFYIRVKRSVDPDGLLNRGLFARFGLS